MKPPAVQLHAFLAMLFAGMAVAQAPQEPQLTPLPHPDIAPPFPVAHDWPWWPVALAVLLMLALLALVVWLLLSRRTGPQPPPPGSPLERAVTALETLQARLAALTPREAGAEVSQVLRHYLEQRYAVPAPYRTSEELYGPAALSPREGVQERFGPVAELHDRLEFAPGPATAEDAASLVTRALEALQKEKRDQAAPPPIPV